MEYRLEEITGFSLNLDELLDNLVERLMSEGLINGIEAG